ncbi:hypothetical protein DDB_G0292960 [Dictyostelium discoideum AX4]|uniref:Ribosomal RNA-processing protein 8 n=1 Tax=Dictyostelium discoideum TaxID=44689 RepID=RRP8_DICDI|nr:hypothetical protein DDB_G0292960 [Dictyostelium discoideum AX4]Q54CP1.1 RecName: Full=Ribosomal RNA-processing protein 8 [Dictyostelium discoideum]EAL61029.1 hypothetical protein DDB_G0292960 [Dictyostelium discoideum AX4]|eukprot:XP_629375.1 hypothetical protein DDB_G0292960 [Dictyostelium discoideum AX4]
MTNTKKSKQKNTVGNKVKKTNTNKNNNNNNNNNNKNKQNKINNKNNKNNKNNDSNNKNNNTNNKNNINIKNKNLKKVENNKSLKVISSNKNKNILNNLKKEEKVNSNDILIQQQQNREKEDITNEDDDEKYNLWNPKPTSSVSVSSSKSSKSLKTTDLQNEMSEKLKGSRFRWLNETLYTTHSKEAFKEFSEDRSLFDQYHSGFKSQVESWPINPLDLIIDDLSSIKQRKRIADLGCGEAKLAERLQHKHTIQSFDLVAVNERVTACDISNLPLKNESIDIAVFCLSLMGTNFIDFIIEAERVLVKGGLLKIAEIESRITDINAFTNEIQQHGFNLIKKNEQNQYFTLFEFSKLQKKDQQFMRSLKQYQKLKKQQATNEPVLKPCLYKKR